MGANKVAAFREFLDGRTGEVWSDEQLSAALRFATKEASKMQGSDQAPGKMMIDEKTFLNVWHDKDADGVEYKRYGITVGPKQPAPVDQLPKAKRRVRRKEAAPEEIDKGALETVQSAGRWLAGKWQSLEARYGKKQALAMAVAMLATLPLPGSVPAIVGVAEGIRGLHGYFARSFPPPVKKRKGPVNRLKRYMKASTNGHA